MLLGRSRKKSRMRLTCFGYDRPRRKTSASTLADEGSSGGRGPSDFKGNLAFVTTKEFWRSEKESPSAQGYHWNTNAETYFLIGEAMGKAMLGLVSSK